MYEYAVPADDRPWSGAPRRPWAAWAAMGGMAMGAMGGMGMGGMGMGGGMGGFAGGAFGGGGLGVPQQHSESDDLSSGGDATVPSEAETSESGGDSMVGIERPRPPVGHRRLAHATGITAAVRPRFRQHHRSDHQHDQTPVLGRGGRPGKHHVLRVDARFRPHARPKTSTMRSTFCSTGCASCRRLEAARSGWRPATVQPVDPDYGLDFDSLIEFITSDDPPASWDEVGGPAASPDEPRGGADCLANAGHSGLGIEPVDDAPPQPVRDPARRSAVGAKGTGRGSAACCALAGGRYPVAAAFGHAGAQAGGTRRAGRPQGRIRAVGVATHGARQDRIAEHRPATAGRPGRNPAARLRPPGRGRRRRDCLAGLAAGRTGQLGRRSPPARRPPPAVACRIAPTTNSPGCSTSPRPTPAASGWSPPALPEDANTWLEAEFAGPSGFPRHWQSQLDGKPTGRMRFDGKTAVMEDAAGKVLARWELVRSESGNVEVPPLEADWQGYVRLDRRSEEPAVDRSVAEAVGAIARSDWPKAAGHLGEALATRPRQPLLLLLTAWCYEQDPRLGSPGAEGRVARRRGPAGVRAV